jgi:16S rRNA C967 or C1407 C5-methylase (RsmB/RsmF family)
MPGKTVDITTLGMNRYASKLAEKLLLEESRGAFLAALGAGRSACPSLLWLAERPLPAPFVARPPAPWQPEFVDALSPGERAGRHALHDAGMYYCLDLSSVFETVPLSLVSARSVLDVCASPGGKSLLAWRMLAPERLVCNEVIGKRLGALTGNLARCNVSAEVTRQDPSVLAAEHPEAFDLVLVDAPCSGQSLLARGQENPGCFHPVNVGACAGRQKRILIESAQCVAPGGFLLYSTCTFSRDENEAIIEWLLARRSDFHAVEVPALAAHRSPNADFPAYRLWPHEGFGAGGFTCLLHFGLEAAPGLYFS